MDKKALEFINNLHKKDKFIYLQLLSEQDKQKSIIKVVPKKELEDTLSDLVRTANERKMGVYMCVNSLKDINGRREIKNIHKYNAFVFDFDDPNQKLSSKYFRLEPHYVFKKEGKFHVYFLLDDSEGYNTKDCRKLHECMIAYYKSDSQCKDQARLFRVPYTKNYKKNYAPLYPSYELSYKGRREKKYTYEEIYEAHKECFAIISDKINKSEHENLIALPPEKVEANKNRNAWLFAHARQLYHVEKKDNIKEEVLKLNRKIKTPLHEREIEIIIEQSKKYPVKYGVPEKEAKRQIREAKNIEIKKQMEDYYSVVYTTDFIHIPTKNVYNEKQFNTKFASLTGNDNSGKYMLKNNLIRQAEKITYNPLSKEELYKEGDELIINSYNPPSLVPKASLYYQKLFMEHVEFLFEKEEEQDILLNYLAYNLQKPSVKFKYAVVLVGMQGNGKSFFLELMTLLLGGNNVSKLSNNSLNEIYTGWQKNICFVCVEELHQPNNRKLINTLKDKITQEHVNMREMYKPEIVIKNTYNFLCCTNHTDALSIDAEDRRWCILSTKHETKDKSYYDALYGMLKDKNALQGILHYLKSKDISKVNPNGHAPKTWGKKVMVESNITDFEDYLRHIHSKKKEIFARDFVRLKSIARDFDFPKEFAHEKNKYKQIVNFLKTNGYMMQDDFLRSREIVNGVEKRIKYTYIRKQKDEGPDIVFDKFKKFIDNRSAKGYVSVL